jgi:hypothetical protein
MLQFCNEEKKNKRFTITLGRTDTKGTKATGKREWPERNIHMNLGNVERRGEKTFMNSLKKFCIPENNSLNDTEKCVTRREIFKNTMS